MVLRRSWSIPALNIYEPKLWYDIIIIVLAVAVSPSRAHQQRDVPRLVYIGTVSNCPLQREWFHRPITFPPVHLSIFPAICGLRDRTHTVAASSTITHLCRLLLVCLALVHDTNLMRSAVFEISEAPRVKYPQQATPRILPHNVSWALQTSFKPLA